MLDFTNVRKTTEQMLVMSRAYTEKFWQQVFDRYFFSPGVDEEFMARDGVECRLIPDLDTLDPEWIFHNMNFMVTRDCYGKICVAFLKGNEHEDEIDLRLSAECLLNNHFTRVDENTFVLQNVLETN